MLQIKKDLLLIEKKKIVNRPEIKKMISFCQSEIKGHTHTMISPPDSHNNDTNQLLTPSLRGRTHKPPHPPIQTSPPPTTTTPIVSNVPTVLLQIYNQSTVVSDIQVTQMVAALNIGLVDFGKEWSVSAMAQFVGGKPQSNPHAYVFTVLDNSDVQGALAYHDEQGNQVDGFVFAHTILLNGGVVLYKDATTPTVASALAHEVYEALIDPTIGTWWQDTTGTLWAAEVADPVENNIIVVTLADGTQVGLSDYVLPAWRDNGATNGPFNKTNTLTKPFTIHNGYAVVIRQSGQPTQIFADGYPEWKKTLKKQYGRRALPIWSCRD